MLLDRTFKDEYDLTLSAWGEGILSERDLLDFQRLDAAFAEFKKKYRKPPRDVSLRLSDSMAMGCDYGITGIDPAFLEKLEGLKELVLPSSVTTIETTEKIEEILRGSRTLIRSTFDSFAERFAAQRGLPFRHADFVFAEDEFAPACEGTTLKMIFMRDGTALIEERVSSPGSSSSNTFGGEFYKTLPGDFFLRMSASDVAERYGERLRGAILSNGRLAAFIEKARAHDVFTGKNK